MTVGELKEMLKDVPDDMSVYYMGDSTLGGFMFIPACSEESGLIDLPAPNEEVGEFGNIDTTIFCLMTCGSTCSEEELNEMDAPPSPEIFN